MGAVERRAVHVRSRVARRHARRGGKRPGDSGGNRSGRNFRRNQPNGYVGLDANGNASIGTTTIGSGQGVNVLGIGAKCDNATDDRVAIQAAITAAAGGGAVIFPEGRTCIISPVADHSKFLSLPAGTHLQGRATLQVKSGSAPYTSVLFAADCTGCLISDITIDSNVAGNPAVNLAELIASPRWEVEILSGSNIVIRGITVKNTNSTNSINVAGSRITVADSIFTGLGDDPNHVVHDVSVFYLYGSQIIVTGNHFTGAYRGAPAAYTAIETHGSMQTVANNTIADMANGMNITGAWNGTSFSGSVTGNVITGAMAGITIDSLKLAGIHDTGDGIDGLTITGNTIRINQLSYAGSVWPNAQTNYGIMFAVGKRHADPQHDCERQRGGVRPGNLGARERLHQRGNRRLCAQSGSHVQQRDHPGQSDRQFSYRRCFAGRGLNRWAGPQRQCHTQRGPVP